MAVCPSSCACYGGVNKENHSEETATSSNRDALKTQTDPERGQGHEALRRASETHRGEAVHGMVTLGVIALSIAFVGSGRTAAAAHRRTSCC